MRRIWFARLGFFRTLGLAAAAMLMLSTAASQRAEAMSPINPGVSSAKYAAEGLMTQVRGSHGGYSGGGGSWHGGSAFRSAPAFHAAPAWHGGGVWHGGSRHFVHFRHHRRFFVGGYYPYYYDDDYYYPSYDYPACRVVLTHWGPRRVCYRGHLWHHRSYHRHRWHHRHYS
jgi:hypothetical protein